MSAREERHCEMMMAQDDAAQTSPDRPLLCVHVCRVSSERPSFPAREIHNVRYIFAREIFPASGHVSSREETFSSSFPFSTKLHVPT